MCPGRRWFPPRALFATNPFTGSLFIESLFVKVLLAKTFRHKV